MYRLTERPYFLLPLLAIPACNAPVVEDRTSTVTLRDSAGIQVVENHTPEWDSVDWTIEASPVFVIGDYRGASVATDTVAPLLWEIGGASVLSDGRVVVLSNGAAMVLLFEPSGTLTASFGGKGRGPGEFSEPQHLQVLPGDTIVVWDYMFGSVQYFDPSGTLLRYRRIDMGAVFAATRTDNQRPPETVRLPLRDGSFLVEVGDLGWQAPADGELYRRPTAYVRIDSTYNAHSFGWWAGREYLYVQPLIPGLVPYRAESWVAADGSATTVYVSPGDRYEVHQFGATGVLRRIIRRARVNPVPILASDVEAWKAQLSGRQRLDWVGWDRAIADNPPRLHRPAVVGLLTDADDYLWVANRLDASTSEWSVFDSRGRWLVTLVLPVPRVTWIGRDLIVGVRRDIDTGVETVEGYRVTRPVGGC